MQNEKIVYFVRHGQSVDNALPVFQSSSSPLSTKGQFQAQQIANRIKHLSFDALVSSPLPRAYETATAIATTTGKQVELSDFFVERIKPTAVDGKPWDDAESLKIYTEWETSLYNQGASVLDGENFDDIMARADAALECLRGRTESTLVVVTHGHFLRTIVARVLLGDALTGEGLKRIQQVASVENTALTVLKYRAAYEEAACWRLWTLNDHAHFAD